MICCIILVPLSPPSPLLSFSLINTSPSTLSLHHTVAFPYANDILCKIEYDAESALPKGTDRVLAVYNITGKTLDLPLLPFFTVFSLLFCSVLYCTVLYCIVLYCTVLYCTVLYCTVLYCTVLYCTVLYCTVLYCTVLYCTVLNRTFILTCSI